MRKANRHIELIARELEERGIEYHIERSGRHQRIYFKTNDHGWRYYLVPSSPGDHRGAMNGRAQLRRMLR
jgi:superfamily I DNA/RNA helicase